MVRDQPPKVDPLRPIHRAIMNNDAAAFRAEVAAGVDINLPGPEDMTPLHIAADRGNIEIAKELLDAGANVDPINVWGNTPLWMAVMKRHLNSPDGSMVRLLLDSNADPTKTESENGRSALVMSRLLAGFPKELAHLVEAKADELKTRG
ncbi:Ankyrin repeat protein [Mycobacteroides salmoniphilum]|uniref:Ankyrin repeat protein n=1 Tax=Mycobacteroides salmoniphilum TaxID=404941 RepID=A0A4R8S4X8_9MYCO|nr:ankyrin repeat domain-containing protein [Mycobacteroides salmoniphilum]TDZ80104.1 Ankyrin repeat protein [Mycobacteroides salmoniphilum]